MSGEQKRPTVLWLDRRRALRVRPDRPGVVERCVVYAAAPDGSGLQLVGEVHDPAAYTTLLHSHDPREIAEMCRRVGVRF